MADIALADSNKRFFFNWIPAVFFLPRRIFQKISASQKAIWLTPLLIISIFAVANVLEAGRLKNQAAASGEVSYPPDFQYYTPEQQAQYMQAIQSTQGPVFVYVLPAITSLIGVWIGWLILGGILHLITTLLGGRGSTAISMNIVAWGSLPLALRALVQIIYMLAAHKVIGNPGLSGFSPVGESGWLLFLSYFLRLVDIYVIWQIILLILGIRISTALNPVKSTISVILTIFIILLIQSGLSYAGSLLSNLSITRPFFF
jgi:Yip1 domain